MGEKYELSLLTNKDNKSILYSAINILKKYGWSYNIDKLGKYSYWKTGPIWKFGESVEIVETNIIKNDSKDIVNRIVDRISNCYSQSISLNRKIQDIISTAIILIVESSSDEKWKEISIAFELNEIFISSDILQKSKKINELKEIFIDLVRDIQPYYGVSGIEIDGVVNEPDLLKIDEETLGDLNYFSVASYNLEQIETLKNKYKSQIIEDFGILISDLSFLEKIILK